MTKPLQYDSYIICGTPRTGSTMLCNLLAATGIAGNPDSFFMRDVDEVWASEWGLPKREGMTHQAYCAAYLKAAIASGKAQTGVFGLRLMRENLGDLMAMIDAVYPGLPEDKSRLQAAFGRTLCIHLLRGDKLAQAVSMVKAEQTGLWHIAPDGKELERLAPPQPPRYDFDRIAAKLDTLTGYDTAWLDWFKAEDIAPLTIEYEALSANPSQIINGIIQELGFDEDVFVPADPGVGRLSDETSREWVRRFRAETGQG